LRIAGRHASTLLLGLIGIALSLALWHYLHILNGNRVPGPGDVFGNIVRSLTDSRGLPGIGLPAGGYLPHLLFTARTVLIGCALGAAIGVFTGLAAASSETANAVLDPIASLLGTVPIIVAAPFFLMWFGVASASQIVLVTFYTAIVLHVYSYRAARNLPHVYDDYARTLGVGRVQRLAAVRLPGVMPEVFGGLRVAAAAAWGLAAVTEMLGAQFGSGRVLVALRASYDLEGIMAVVICLAALAILYDAALVALRAYVLRWAPKGTRT
jgi:ABC-type nitrate/sulfonate/bicarbonate transport system permease component